MKRIRAVIYLCMATGIVVALLNSKGSMSIWPTSRGALHWKHLAKGTYQLESPGGSYDNLDYQIDAGAEHYYIVGAGKNGPNAGLQVKENADGGTFVPDISMPSGSDWGPVVQGVQIGVALDRSTVVAGRPLFGQVTIVNKSDVPFETRYGCGPNMELALPEIKDANGTPVQRYFTIGQSMCAGIWPFNIPPKSACHFIFDVDQLYAVLKPGDYTVSVALPEDTGFKVHTFRPGAVVSGTVQFKTTEENGD